MFDFSVRSQYKTDSILWIFPLPNPEKKAESMTRNSEWRGWFELIS